MIEQAIHLAQRVRRAILGNCNLFLRSAKGVIHVGANVGHERHTYAEKGLPVLWIEPIPHVFAQLEANILEFPRQRAVQALVTDEDGAKCWLNISTNDGLSSSIFDLTGDRCMYPDVHYVDRIKLVSQRLDSIVASSGIRAADYDALVLDVQGAELLVLRGAIKTLRHMRFVKAEVPDLNSYDGGQRPGELVNFMLAFGFREKRRDLIRSEPGVGSYFDILFCRP